jgi:hypothetical protein
MGDDGFLGVLPERAFSTGADHYMGMSNGLSVNRNAKHGIGRRLHIDSNAAAVCAFRLTAPAAS